MLNRTVKWAALISLVGTATVANLFGGGCIGDIVSWVTAPVRFVLGGFGN